MLAMLEFKGTASVPLHCKDQDKVQSLQHQFSKTPAQSYPSSKQTLLNSRITTPEMETSLLHNSWGIKAGSTSPSLGILSASI
jgi:hypothetical protein